MSEKKKPRPLNVRERKFIKAVAEGHRPTEAMRIAGYSEKTARHKQSQKLAEVGTEFQKLMEKMGLSDDMLLNKLKEGLQATKHISCNIIAGDGEGMKDANSMTKDFVSVEDYPTQRQFLDMAFKLKDRYPSEKKNITTEHIGSIPVTIVDSTTDTD